MVSRATVIAAAAAVAALGFASAYVWGIDVAQRGMERIMAAPQGEDESARTEPSRARLFLRHVQLLLSPASEKSEATSDAQNSDEALENPSAVGDEALKASHHGRVGYSPEASLRLPRSYGLEESKQGWDLLRIAAAGPQGLRVEAIAHPEPSQNSGGHPGAAAGPSRRPARRQIRLVRL